MTTLFKTLETVAVATDHNGKEYRHKVTLRRSDYDKIPSLVLRIEDTPGSWYLSTLFGTDGWGKKVGNTIAIDYGQNWYCVNMDQITKEVESLIGTAVKAETFEPIELQG